MYKSPLQSKKKKYMAIRPTLNYLFTEIVLFIDVYILEFAKYDSFDTNWINFVRISYLSKLIHISLYFLFNLVLEQGDKKKTRMA